MRPYGAHDKSPRHISGIQGWYDVWESNCGCCDGKYCRKKKNKPAKDLKAYERRQNKVFDNGAIV